MKPFTGMLLLTACLSLPLAALAQAPSKPSTGSTPTPSPMAPKSTSMKLPEFASVDTNHDGSIDMKEADTSPDVRAAFKDMDKNNNGKVTRAEWTAYEANQKK